MSFNGTVDLGADSGAEPVYPVGSLTTTNESDERGSQSVSKRTRRRVTRAADNGERHVATQPQLKKQRLKRGYAPPEVYAHLSHVQDCLDYDLNSKQNCLLWSNTPANAILSLVLRNQVSEPWGRYEDDVLMAL